ncbi:MAG: enoyl-CoA hydratase/isomerase family protein [Acidimicrobiales bacterium]
MTQPDAPLLTENIDGVLSIKLNRPERKNALTRELITLLRAALDTAGDDVRAIVISGNGATFSSGVDLNDPAILDGPPFAEVLHGLARAVRACDKPVIAAVEGYAYGAGLSLALASDIRIVAPTAQLCEAYIRIGRYSGGGDTVMLPRAIGTGRALRLLWSGDSISGEQALAIGLADELADDPPAAAMELASKIAGKNPSAIALTKRAVYETASLSWDDALERSIELALRQHSTVEGVTPQGREEQ